MKSTYKLIKRNGLFVLTDAVEKNEIILCETLVRSYYDAKKFIQHQLTLKYDENHKYYYISVICNVIAISTDVDEITKIYANITRQI